MYISDYGYAASPDYWTYVGYSDSGTDYRLANDNNWMYLGVKEWTITRRSDYAKGAIYISDTGCLSGSAINTNGYAIRPTFYLNTTAYFDTGSGTRSDPYRLKSN